jgi:hypothetical protein
LFTLSFVGMWLPIPSLLVAVALSWSDLRRAPPSLHRTGAFVMVGIMSLVLVAVIAAISVGMVAGDGRNDTPVIIAAGVTLPLWFASVGLFLYFADTVYRALARSGLVDVVSSDAADARGVNLGLGLAGLFVFPIFSLVGVPVTLYRLRRLQGSAQFDASLVLGVMLVAMALAFLLSLIVALVVDSGETLLEEVLALAVTGALHFVAAVLYLVVSDRLIYAFIVQ